MPELDNRISTENPEAEDDLLEDDGDSFWMIQRFVWGTIKTILLLGGIALVLWLIWGNGNMNIPNFDIKLPSFKTDSIRDTDTNTSPEKKSEAINNQLVDSLPHIINHPSSKPLRIKNPVFLADLSWSAARWNYWLVTQIDQTKKTNESKTNNESDFLATKNTGKATEQAVKWLRDSEKFFAVKPVNWVNGDNPSMREVQLNRMIRTIDYLLQRSTSIKLSLRNETVEYRQVSLVENTNISAAESQIKREIERLEGTDLENFMRQKIMAENQKFSAETQVWLRTSLVQRIEAYELPLRNLRTNVEANKRAIIYDVRVINFPGDPFQRVRGQ